MDEPDEPQAATIVAADTKRSTSGMHAWALRAPTRLDGTPSDFASAGSAYFSADDGAPFALPGALAETPLLEREHELSAFDGLLNVGEPAGSRLVLVEGTAGIGKSRLLAELRARAGSRGMKVLAAHSSELEREFPFGVVRQLYEPLLADAVERKRLLVDAAAAAAPVLEKVHAHDEVPATCPSQRCTACTG
jgi:hypothetical protein